MFNPSFHILLFVIKMSPTNRLLPHPVFRLVQSNLKYFWLLQEDWKMTILFQGSLFWSKIRPCKWSKQRMAVRAITSGAQIMTALWCFHTKGPSILQQDLHAPALPNWGILNGKKYIQKKKKISGTEAKGHPDMGLAVWVQP